MLFLSSRLIILTTFMVFIVSCASMFKLSDSNMQEFSAGDVGCPPPEIKISKYVPGNTGSYTGTWIAECEGKMYFCSRTTAGKGTADVKCKEKKK